MNIMVRPITIECSPEGVTIMRDVAAVVVEEVLACHLVDLVDARPCWKISHVATGRSIGGYGFHRLRDALTCVESLFDLIAPSGWKDPSHFSDRDIRMVFLIAWGACDIELEVAEVAS